MSLQADIVDRYGSVYKFWKAHKDCLPSKGTVYQVVAGTYAGDLAGQERRMSALMHGEQAPQELVDGIFGIIKKVACSRCPDKDSPGPRCTGCLELFRAQAKAVVESHLFTR
ncbi:MAG: hypothetical protein WC340_15880 [Kiritimatiellia bacterium]